MKTPGRGSAIAALVTATLLWGATFVVIRDSVRGIDPVVLVFTRFAIAAVLLAVAALALRIRPNRAAWSGGTLSGLLAAAGFVFQAIGLRHTSAGTSAFLTCTGSLFAGVLAWPLLRERPGGSLVLGIALATLGAALLSNLHGFSIGPGEAWTLLGAVAWGLQIVVLARYAPGGHPLTITLIQAATIAVVLAPWGATGSIDALAPDAARWRVGYLAIAGSAIAPFLQIHAQRTLSAGRVGLLLALEPVFALLFAIAVGAERFTASWWFGAGLILAGVLWVEWRAARAAGAPASAP